MIVEIWAKAVRPREIKLQSWQRVESGTGTWMISLQWECSFSWHQNKTLSVIIVFSFSEKKQIPENNERNRMGLRKKKNPNSWLCILICKWVGLQQIQILTHHTSYFHYQISFILPPLDVSPKIKPGKLPGLLELDVWLLV